MTLTELRYIVAVARERHFGRAAEKCYVSQPALSVAIKKLEDELGVALFERNSADVSVTPVGARIVEQAQRVLEETAAIKEIATQGKDQLAAPLRVGAIYTVGPYLLPQLIPIIHRRAPKMPLLLLGAGNCFREQVLQTCPRLNRSAASSIQQALEGSSLETIRQMVACGAGITVLPSTAADTKSAASPLLAARPFTAPQPSRRIALAWRKSFPRPQAVAALRDAVLACKLPGITPLPAAPAAAT